MNIKEVFNKYFEDKGRIGVTLSILLHNLRNQPSITYLEGLWKAGDDILKLFKIIILLHECFQQQILHQEDGIQILGKLINKATQGFKKKPNKFEEYLFTQGIQPYALYLQKKLQNQNDPQLDKETLLYKDLNLLKRGVSFSSILYTFGRYFSKSHEFFIDFNIIVAREASHLYHIFQARLARCKYMYNSELRQEVQNIHEKMYIIYYNAYYHREVRDYVPRWLNTEQRKSNNSLSAKSSRSLKKKLSLPNQNIQNCANPQKNGFLSSRKNIPLSSRRTRKNTFNMQINSTSTLTTQRSSCLFSLGNLGRGEFTEKRGSFQIYYDEEDNWWMKQKNCPKMSKIDSNYSQKLDERLQLIQSMEQIVIMLTDEE